MVDQLALHVAVDLGWEREQHGVGWGQAGGDWTARGCAALSLVRARWPRRAARLRPVSDLVAALDELDGHQLP